MPSSVVDATLIGDLNQLRLSDARIKRAAQGVTGFESWRWLNEGVAADLFFSPPLERSDEAHDFQIRTNLGRESRTVDLFGAGCSELDLIYS
jgi:hypothetical protein